MSEKTYWIVLHKRTRRPLTNVYDTRYEAKMSRLNFHKKHGVTKEIVIKEVGK